MLVTVEADGHPIRRQSPALFPPQRGRPRQDACNARPPAPAKARSAPCHAETSQDNGPWDFSLLVLVISGFQNLFLSDLYQYPLFVFNLSCLLAIPCQMQHALSMHGRYILRPL